LSKSLNDVYDDLLILIYSKFLDIVKTLRVEKARGMRIIKIRVIFKDESFLDVIWDLQESIAFTGKEDTSMVPFIGMTTHRTGKTFLRFQITFMTEVRKRALLVICQKTL